MCVYVEKEKKVLKFNSLDDRNRVRERRGEDWDHDEEEQEKTWIKLSRKIYGKVHIQLDSYRSHFTRLPLLYIWQSRQSSATQPFIRKEAKENSPYFNVFTE